jgi:CheY-like chemotaxis protein
MKKKIVLIEDNKAVRENIEEILELANYEVFAAPNGKKGVDLVQSETPDLIICDIMMPELDGYGVLHMLSKNPKHLPSRLFFLRQKPTAPILEKEWKWVPMIISPSLLTISSC